MKKYLGILAIASLGGLVALGVNKLITKNDPALFEKNYLARYASLTDLGTRTDFVEVSQLVTPTVVHIITRIDPDQASNSEDQTDPFRFFHGPGFQFQQQPQVASGSGVIISQDGYIVTNNHVIDGASKIRVTLHDKREYDATLVGRDPNTDLALLRIDEKNLAYALVGNSDEVKVGQWVLAVGNPFNLTSTVTAGIVSAKGRNLNLPKENNQESQYSIESFIQTDAAVNPGNSGGALVNAEGKLIGINTAIASERGTYVGYAFAVPSNLMKKVIDDLLRFGEVQRGIIGVQIQEINASLADKEGLKEVKGVFVSKVQPGSAAEEAGMKDKDVILSINETLVNSPSELQELVAKRNPGDKIKVLGLRDGKEREFSVVLKNKEGKTTLGVKEKVEVNNILNCDFESLTREERLSLHLNSGVRVKKIGEKSELKKAGVQNGFIITKIDKVPVSNVNDVKMAFSSKKGGVLIEGINPDGSKGYYGFGVDEK